MTIEELEIQMEAATKSFCKTRRSSGDTGMFPAIRANGCTISDAEGDMEKATQAFLHSRSA